MGRKRVALVIRDGWGLNPSRKLSQWDATEQGNAPHALYLRKNWPHTKILTGGLAVGLPDGVMGNSEVGHQNIGAGRVVEQEIVRIDDALADGTLAGGAALQRIFAAVKNSGGKLHLMGLYSDGGVHSVTRHAIGLLKLAKNAGILRVCFHVLTDGRDTPPGSGLGYVEQLEREMLAIGCGKIVTVIGRFWAMDRDSRWERVERAYRCLVGEPSPGAPSARVALEDYYAHPTAPNQSGDEFLPPTQIVDGDGNFSGEVADGDGFLLFNFRGDRPREITHAFVDGNFPHFHRRKKLAITYATMTDYEKGLCPNVLFPKPPPMGNILGSYLSRMGLRQFRTAETEKYAHVTFFFNDYREEPFPGEERQLIASPKDVATYDLKPEMSARAVCDGFVAAMASKRYDFLTVNFANADMVGHTGNFAAAKRAVETVDDCIGKILAAADISGTDLIVGADHGNAEEMWDSTLGIPHTQHTLNPVELFLYGNSCKNFKLLGDGKLADIAPTILRLLGLEQPEEMTGRCLIAGAGPQSTNRRS